MAKNGETKDDKTIVGPCVARYSYNNARVLVRVIAADAEGEDATILIPNQRNPKTVKKHDLELVLYSKKYPITPLPVSENWPWLGDVKLPSGLLIRLKLQPKNNSWSIIELGNKGTTKENRCVPEILCKSIPLFSIY